MRITCNICEASAAVVLAHSEHWIDDGYIYYFIEHLLSNSWPWYKVLLEI